MSEPRIRSGTDALERPAELRAGQRWRPVTAPKHNPVLTRVRADGYWTGNDCEHCGGQCGGWFAESLLRGTFLGYAETPGEAPAKAIDWSRWLPPSPLPGTGAKDLKPGQVWAVRCKSDKQGAIRRIVGKYDGRYFVYEHLAGDQPGAFFAGDKPTYADNSGSANCSVLVQDVGQADPTPPEVLFGGALATPAKSAEPTKSAPHVIVRREVSCDGKHWVDFSRLVDGDAFEAYPWRRTWERTMWGETRYTLDAFPPPKPDPIANPRITVTAGDAAGAAAAALVGR